MRLAPFTLARALLICLSLVSGACAESQIVPDAGEDASNVSPVYIGGPCRQPEDCVVDGHFDPTAAACLPGPGGYCSVLGCVLPGFACPGSSQCVPSVSGPPGFCMNPCVDESDCRTGFECHERASGFRFCRAIPEDAGVDGG